MSTAPPETRFANILVAVDGSESAQRAVDVAIALGTKFRARLTVLHILDVPVTPYSSDQPVEVEIRNIDSAARTEGEKMVSSAAALAKEMGIERITEKVIKSMGSVSDGITEYAKENGMDIIVVGTRGSGRIKKLLVGSIATGVVNSAPCSVVVVREQRHPGSQEVA